MEDTDMRNMLLSELIDKMHGRLADKMFPTEAIPMPDADMADQPAAAMIPGTEAMKDEKSIDTDKDSLSNNDNISDEELDALMKEVG